MEVAIGVEEDEEKGIVLSSGGNWALECPVGRVTWASNEKRRQTWQLAAGEEAKKQLPEAHTVNELTHHCCWCPSRLVLVHVCCCFSPALLLDDLQGEEAAEC